MKKSIVSITILLAVSFTATILLTSCSTKKSEQQEQTGDAKADSTVTAYACPMHPEVTGKDGDKCSKCGMKLEAMKEKEGEHKH